MQLSNTPGKLLLPFAAVGGKNTIPVDSQIGIVAGKASLSDGFPPLTRTPLSAGGVPPSGLDMNGILYEMSAVIRWANAGGGYAYDASFATDVNVGGYPKGARVMRSDGVGYWFNTVENNTTDPETAGAAAAGWVPDFTSGASAITMTNANVTLTPLQYGKRVIVITGLLTSNLNLIFPSIPGEWSIINGTTGSYSITAKTAAGTGVVIGEVSQIVGNGVNIYAANPNSIQIVSNVAALRGINPTLTRRIQTRGYYGDGDGGSGAYFPKTGAAPGTYVDNGGTVILPTGGDGSSAWLLDVTDGIVSLKQFGAVGDGSTDDTVFVQKAINVAPTFDILANAGTYKITTTLTYSTVGLGDSSGLRLRGEGRYKTFFDNQTGATAFICTSGTGLEFQFGTVLDSFSIINTLAGASTVGVKFIGLRQSAVRNVRVIDQASHGIYFPSSTGDGTDCSQVVVEGCDISGNGGFGLIAYGDPDAINSNIITRRNRVIDNALGGIAYYSVIQGVIENNAIAYNGGKGVIVGHAGGPFSKSVTINNNEFDSNTGTQLYLDQITGATIGENYFICNNSAPVVTKNVEITANAASIEISGSVPRMPSGYSGVTMYSIASGASTVRILDTLWQSWEAAGNTKYSDAGTKTIILDSNEYLTPIRANNGIAFPSVAVASADPNTLDDYEEGTWVATVTGATNFTGTPTFAFGRYVKIGRLVTLEGELSGTVTATGSVNITFSIPFPTTDGVSAAIGAAAETNQIAVGYVFDTTAGSDNSATLWFPSLDIGARIMRFTYSYMG